jgi:RES domain-containing protein
MAHDPNVTSLTGESGFRYADYDSPFWSRSNQSAGRWHFLGDEATQYISLSPDGAWAELTRNEGLRTESEVELVRTKLWVVTLNQNGLMDYSTFEKAESAGFPPEALIDEDWSRCQDEGRRLRNEGHMGVIAPNAALPGALNVTLFGPRVASTWGVPTRLRSSIPACVAAIGSPPPGLVGRVRHRDEPHLGFAEYFERVAEGSRREQPEPA